ncbi:Ribonuclease P protein subunit p30 [Eufriesea mexicana]|uniref:Ribonuclease P protein subunit p30 n=1 Tax=Eufriesea mexicana TaxID=516756 RepID=A0A310SRV6_9HYME|nr:PREDICTED: ribonuclease P protein subunit p30 [Eufriesea mexicana]OAD58136.1 Ribonuclease P protein subunit p30 [Eufriesea mexicana]
MNIRESTGFYDLCVNVRGNEIENLYSVLSKLYEYGFKTVAINTNIDESVLGIDKKKKKRNDSEVSQSISFKTIDIENIRKEFDGKLQIFNRISFWCSDVAKTHILNHCSNFKKYDLYAFVPKTQNALQFACTQLNADIITLRSNSITFKFNKKLYDQAVERGIHFEIQYIDLLNIECRKHTIHYAHLFHTYGKSKNVILSSGSNDAKTIRNPYDLINLACLLGLNEVKAKASILHQCRRLLLRAERRRRGKAAFIIKDQTKSINVIEEDTKTTKKVKL